MTKRECQCAKCKPRTTTITGLSSIRTVVCEHCGNRRCPHAEDHSLLCMGSNAPNQPKVLRHPRAPLTLSQSEAAD